MNTYVVLLDIAKFPFIGTVPICIPTAIDSLFHHSFANRVYCQAFEFLPDKREMASQQFWFAFFLF